MRAPSIALCALLVLPAHADEATAKLEFERGRELYSRGQYTEALPHLRRAYTLSGKRPSTIRALAQCEGMLGSYQDAIALLREYLATDPPAEDRASAEALISELEAKVPLRGERPRDPDAVWDAPQRSRGEDPRQQPVEPEPLAIANTAPPPPAEPSILEQPWFWIVSGAVLVLGGTAVALSLTLKTDAPEPFGGSTGTVLHR